MPTIHPTEAEVVDEVLMQAFVAVIVKNSSPPPTIGRQITNSLPTGHRQVTNRLRTVSKNTREKKYSTETYVKTNKTYQKRRTKSEKLTKSEEQLIVNPEVWINMEKKPSSEDQAFEKDVWIKM